MLYEVITLATPEGIMLARIGVYRLARSTMHAQVRLPITFEIESAHDDAAGDRPFEDAGRYGFSLPRHLLRKTYVD